MSEVAVLGCASLETLRDRSFLFIKVQKLRRCVSAIRESPQDEKLHHRVTWAHMREGAVTRAQLEEYVDGRDLRDLHALKALVYELKFIPTVERLQEGDHGILLKAVNYKKISGPFVSCSLRLPEIRSLMQAETQYLDFLKRFSEVEKLDDLAKRFGFHQHEQWQLACHERRSKKQKMILASLIMYSMDFETQFANMTSVRKSREKRARERKCAEEKWKSHFQSKRSFSLQCIEELAMSSHLQSELQVGRLYSLPAGAAAIRSLPSSLQPQNSLRARSLESQQAEVLALTSDVQQGPDIPCEAMPCPKSDQAQDSGGQQSLFRSVTCAQPSRHKLVRLSMASARNLAADDLCVTLHRSLCGDGSCFVEVDAAKRKRSKQKSWRGKGEPIGPSPLPDRLPSVHEQEQLMSLHQAPQSPRPR